MFYNMEIQKSSYLCSVIKRKIIIALQNVGSKKRGKIMKKNSSEKIVMLQYRIKRYQAMGNGAMCQALNGQLQKLLLQQSAL